MKRQTLLPILLLCCLLLGACASDVGTGSGRGSAKDPLDPQKPVTVTLWHYYVSENQQMLEQAVSDFNQTVGIERGVIIDAVAMGSIAELETEITNAAMGVINAQPMPQLFSSYPDKAMEIDALDMVADLNDYFSDAEKEAYVSDFLQDGIIDGKMLLVPIAKSTELLYLNATNWEAFAGTQGLDASALKTWESLYETSRAYYQWTATEADPWSGKGMMGFDSVANYIIIGSRQMGLEVIDAAGSRANLDRDTLRRLFDLYYKGASLGYFDAVSRFRSDDIKAGDLIAYVGSSSSAAYFPTWIEQDGAQAPIDFLAAAYPVFEGGESYAIQQGAGMCVAKSTPGQEAGAVLFLKWFTSPEENIRFAMTTGYLPVQAAAYDADAFREMLTSLRAGDQAQQNVASVYDVSLEQITALSTYAAKPFPGSYGVRSILQSTLIEAGEAGIALAAPLKASGADEAAILEALDTDAAFEMWLQSVYTKLDEAKIAHTP